MSRTKMKVLSVFGTRPEAIKMAPIIKELERHLESIESKVCVTAQQRQMLDQILSVFGITPSYDLNIMKEGQSLAEVSAAVFSGLGPIFKQEQPDWVLVQGDTTTVAIAALAAFYSGAKVGHVEAGLRTFDKAQPFPEEVNRRIAGVVADLHFAPTPSARKNLLREGIAEEAIVVTGNPVVDALLSVADLPYDPAGGPLSGIHWGNRIILVTAHRRENFGIPMEEICHAPIDIVNAVPDIQVIFPVHMNPHVREPVERILSCIPRVTLTKPLDYLPLVHLMKRSLLILTDSGGIQEEAPSLGKPVLVLREVTERPEAVGAGTVRVIGTRRERIVTETLRLIEDRNAYLTMARVVNPYGDGFAAGRIVKALYG